MIRFEGLDFHKKFVYISRNLFTKKIKNCCMFRCVNISGEDIAALLESHILWFREFLNDSSASKILGFLGQSGGAHTT